ncbi:MAG: hypothetical protein GY729_21405, partial [Desulfobacteraceae bacterium]|nr:hypothetical protein [Desulfobacteraceae bacterium]
MHESKIVDRFQSKKTTRRKFIQFLYSSGLALFAPAVFANNHFGNKKEALSKIMEKIESLN